MQYRYLTAATLFAIATADVQTVTDHQTTDVTITSCSDHACTKKTSLEPAATTLPATVITTTVNDEETIYTTVCPETETPAPAPVAPTSEAPAPAPPAPTSAAPANTTAPAPAPPAPVAPSSVAPVPVAPTSAAPANTTAPAPAPVPTESDSYVDVTVTPTVTASTGVEATVTSQSTLTSQYSSAPASSALAPAAVSENDANKVAFGFAGLAAMGALLL